MTDLTGKKIANTYKDLLQVNSSASNSGLDETLRRVQDGSGKNSAISLSQNAAVVNGTMGVTGSMSVAGGLAVGSLTIDGLDVSAINAVDISTTNITVGGDRVITSAIAASAQAILRSEISTSIIAIIENTSAALQSDINTLSATVSALDVQTSLNANNIGILQTSVAANASAIALVSNAVTSVNTRIQSVSALAETKASVATSANLESRINSVSANLVSTSAALESHINTVSASLSSTNTSVAANSSAIAVNSAAITSINNFIAGGAFASAATSANLETRINSVSVLAETKASAATSANLETRINAVSALTQTNKTSIAANASAIAVLQGATYASAGTSATLESRIAGVSSTMATSISSSNSAIAALSATMATSVNTRVLKSGDTMTGNLTLNADPTAALHAATKSYVDNLTAAGIHYHDAVRLEQEGNLTATYDNGAAGVGATLTNAGAQAILVVDSVTVANDDRLLIYEQTDATQNGVYVVTTVGSPSTNWVLTRSTDTDSTGNNDSTTLDQGSYFFVQEGAAGAGESYVCNVETTITFGTTDITFVQFSSQIQYTAGTGINISPSRIISVSAVASAGTSATLETRINSVSALAETKASAATSANLETRINAVSALAETKASAATSANLETRINAVSALAETKASATTSANLETRINTVSALAETKASAATSANLETRINAVSAIVPTSLTELGITDGSNGQVLQTDGNSVFTFVSVAGGGSGTVTNIKAGSNISMTEAGTTVTETTTSATIAVTSNPTFSSAIITGNVLIGTDSGDAFHADSSLRLQSSGNNYIQMKTPTGNQGGFLIGDTDDDFVGGWIYTNSGNYLSFYANNAARMRLESDGDLHVDGNVIAYSTTISDKRLKKDIAPIDNALWRVKQLNGCTFTYLKDDRESAGLIAQDLEKVLPSAVIEDEAVFHGKEGETYKTVQYDQVIGLLVEAIKELTAKVEELENGSSE